MSDSATRWLVTVAILTLGMGAAVTVSWFAFAARDESYGLDPASVLTTSRLLVYASQSVLVAGFVYWVASRRMRGMSPVIVAALVTTAWVGEGLVLTLIGEPIVANELDPEIAWYFWLVATGGPLQPAVAFGAGWLGAPHDR